MVTTIPKNRHISGTALNLLPSREPLEEPTEVYVAPPASAKEIRFVR